MKYDDPNDDNLYFDEKQNLLPYLNEIEQENLFEINLLGEEENALEEVKKLKEKNIEIKGKAVTEMDNNIKMLENSKKALEDKKSYFDQKLQKNTVVETGKVKSATTSSYSRNKSKKDLEEI